MGGRIVGAQVLAIGRFVIKVQELHSTKGWKPPCLVSKSRFPWAPVIGTFSWIGGCGPQPDRKRLQVRP